MHGRIVNARARNEAKKRNLLADVERALLEALAESAEMHKVLYRLQRAGWPLEVVPLGDLPWPTKLGTSRTSLALLGRAG